MPPSRLIVSFLSCVKQTSNCSPGTSFPFLEAIVFVANWHKKQQKKYQWKALIFFLVLNCWLVYVLLYFFQPLPWCISLGVKTVSSSTKQPGLCILNSFPSLPLATKTFISLYDRHFLWARNRTDTSPDKGWKGSDSFSKSLGAPYHFQLPFILDFSTAVWLEILELPQGSRAQLGTDCRERSLLLKMK